MSLLNSPLNKNYQTQALELIVKMMLHCPAQCESSIKSIDGQLSYIVKINDKDINVSQLIRQANLNHLSLDEKDGQSYFQSKAPLMASEKVDISYDNSPKYMPLSHGEQLAIKDFTLSSNDINNFLYQNLIGFSDKSSQTVDLIFLSTMMMASGINKIEPDTIQPILYRGDSYISEEAIKAYINDIGDETAFTIDYGFKSMSNSDFVSASFAEGIFIIYDNVYAKDISGLSVHPLESEFVLNCSNMQWISHDILNEPLSFIKTLEDPETAETFEVNVTLESGTHVFHANAVNPLIYTSSNDYELAKSQFKEIFDVAQNSGINTDFITTFNMNIIDDINAEFATKQTYENNDTNYQDLQTYQVHDTIVNLYPANYVVTASIDANDDLWYLALRHGEYDAQVDLAVGEIFKYFLPESPEMHIVQDYVNHDYYIASKNIDNVSHAYPENSNFKNYGSISVLAYFVGETDYHGGNYLVQQYDTQTFNAIKIDHAESLDYEAISNPVTLDDILDNHWEFSDSITETEAYQNEQINMIHKIAQTPFDVFEGILRNHITSTQAESTLHFMNKLLESDFFENDIDSQNMILEYLDLFSEASKTGDDLSELGFTSLDQILERLNERHESFKDISAQLIQDDLANDSIDHYEMLNTKFEIMPDISQSEILF